MEKIISLNVSPICKVRPFPSDCILFVSGTLPHALNLVGQLPNLGEQNGTSFENLKSCHFENCISAVKRCKFWQSAALSLATRPAEFSVGILAFDLIAKIYCA